MKVIYDSSAAQEFQFTVEPVSLVHKAAVDAMRHWHNIEDLPRFANDRHGYGDSDGYFGITYPSDLDEFDISQGESIAEGHVVASASYGDPHAKAFSLPESEYIQLLGQYLELSGKPELAKQVRNYNAEQGSEPDCQ
jgi:hypothetical protein